MKKRSSPEVRKEIPPVPHRGPSLVESVGHAKRPFPIVGLGASAGGLEALEQFLGHIPRDCGLGFVVVQHLDPTRKGILVELLQRSTCMRVVQIKDRTKVEPNHVYVIPPNKDLSILHGVLHLLEPAAPRGLRLPIDFFFRSLADDWQEQSMGVILSGMGSDGALGLAAIKEKAGAIFVQAPASAKFDSMPRAAIDAGLADVVAPPGELPGKIMCFLKNIPLLRKTGQDMDEKEQSALEKVVILLRAQAGQDFSLYKKSTIYRRIERRMSLHQIAKIADYVRYLRENSQETELLFKELLIGVTSFFRDPLMWEQLKEKVLPGMLAARPHGGVLRVWTAGCSTGEEAYSLAMIFKEVLDLTGLDGRFSLQIFATDLDREAIEKARLGCYPANISADVSEERLRRFFIKNEDKGYSVKKEIREMVIFAPQNLVMDPPFTKLDLLTCRNLLIYFEAELQKKLMPLFHYSLNPGGVLFLGSAETVGLATSLFTLLPGKARCYRKLDSLPQANLDFPSAFARGPSGGIVPSSGHAKTTSPALNLQSVADQVLLRHYSPPAVLVTKEGDILYVSGKTGKYLEPAAGKANLNLFAMAREGLVNALSEAFHKAVRQKITVAIKNVKVGTDGGTQIVDITVQPLSSPEPVQGMVMVVFADAARRPDSKEPARSKKGTLHNARLAAMAEELQQAHEELQGTRDEMQTSQEELKSTNEELQSMNEELQSTNEELTTSKEEMQSMNEELQTVNHELQAKVEELSLTGNDMKNLLNSTDIATLFLDESLHVRRFTPRTVGIVKLIPSDVGRPITDIVTTLNYPELAQDTREVMRTLTFVERQVATLDKRWFSVRIMPYCTLRNEIQGAVITFSEITIAKNLEMELRKAQADLETRFTRQKGELDKTQGGLRKASGRSLAARSKREKELNRGRRRKSRNE